MDKPISVGDMVVKVRTCCAGRTVNMGVPFQVTGFHTSHGCCPTCGFSGDLTYAEPNGIYIGWLQRIPPLGELEGVDEREPILIAAD